MQAQRTKTFIPQQLSRQEVINYFFPRPYPVWVWVTLVGGGIFIGLGLILQRGFVSASSIVPISIGAFLIWRTNKSNPDDRQYDAWVENQGQMLCRRGLYALDITKAEMHGRMLHIRSYVLPGSLEANEYDAVWTKQGKDGYYRFSINVYTYIYPLERSLAIFTSDVNANHPGVHNDHDEIYSYRYIVGATTTKRTRETILLNERRFPYQMEQFCLKILGGDTVNFGATVKAKPPGSIAGIPVIRLPETDFNRTLNTLRKLLDAK